MRTTVIASVLSAAILAFTGAATAQTSGFALNRFNPAEAGSDWFIGESLDLRGRQRPAFGVIADWSHRPLVEYDASGDAVRTVVSHQVFTHIDGNLILGDRVRVGVLLPVLLFQAGTGTFTPGGSLLRPERGVAVGDLRLSGDIRLVGSYGKPLTLAVGAQLYLPTGSRDAFSGDGTVRLNPRILIAGDIGPFVYSGRLSFNYRPYDDGFGVESTGSEVAFVATAGFRVMDRKLTFGPELWGSTVVSEGDAAFNQAETPFELLFGAHFREGPIQIGVGAGPGLNRGMGAPEFRLVGSLAYQETAVMDRDGDGIPDEEDACPDVPGVPNDDPLKHGCPPDRDGDGIPDLEDACPDVPGVPTDDPATNGCPPDRDGDGIPDAQDACPDVPGVPSDDPTKNGCPDRDGDGIFDMDDACPDRPGVPSDDPRMNGCPPDRDGDGIFDPDDACPDIPGLPNEDPAVHGCPIAHVVKNQIRIYQRIEFEFDKAVLLPSSEVVLTAVLEILQQRPELTEILVEGHTDAVGTAEYNRRLSQARATTVVKWLWARGIERLRLQPVGRGFDEPIADNDTPVGRQKNRRVEFHILSINGEPVQETQMSTPPTETVED